MDYKFKKTNVLVHPYLVLPALRDVPHPWESLVPGLLNHLEVAHLDPTDGEVGNLELDLDGRLATLRGGFAGNRGQAELGAQEELLPSGKVLDLPHQRLPLGGVLGAALGGANHRVGRVARHGDADLDIRRRAPRLVLRPGLDQVLDSASARVVHGALDPDQGLDSAADSVGHEVKCSVRGNEGDGSVVLEPGEPDALVELHVLQVNALALAALALALQQDPVVQSELALGHPGEVGPHLEGAHDLAAHDAPVGVDEEVDALDDVEKDLVFLVLDALAPPADGVRDRHGGLALDHVHLLGLRLDELLKNVRLGELGVTKVHHLIKKLVDRDKIVPHGLLLELLKVLCEDVDQLVQKVDRRRRVHVRLCDGEEVQVAVLEVQVRDALVLDNRARLARVLELRDLLHEAVRVGDRDVAPVVSVDDDLPLQVQNKYGRRRHVFLRCSVFS